MKKASVDWTAFIETLRSEGNVAAACRAVSVSRSGAYDRRAHHPAFAARWDDAEAEAVDGLERVAWQRASSGASDTMLIFLLKAHRREKYGDRTDVKHSGNVGLTVTADDVLDALRGLAP